MSENAADAAQLLMQLLEAIVEHEKACEREVSKAAWSRANGQLYSRAREVARQVDVDAM